MYEPAGVPFVSYIGRGEFEDLDDPLQVPELLLDAVKFIDDSDSFARHLSDAGAVCVESYGEADEGMDIWAFAVEGQRQWFCQYWNGNAPLVNILIGDLLDFLDFQARWAAPMARKIMEADGYFRWQESLRAKEWAPVEIVTADKMSAEIVVAAAAAAAVEAVASIVVPEEADIGVGLAPTMVN